MEKPKYKGGVQDKNIAWFLPRPGRNKYKGGMPLHCENWLMNLAREILKTPDIRILNLFCGMNQQGLRIDLNPLVEPDHVYDAHKITEILDRKFDVILADPPYSDDEAERLYENSTLKLPKLQYKK